jgi:hypothetical protein
MAMLFRYALPHGTYSDYHSSPVFADVTYGSPFHDPITWAGTLGITAGHSDGSFGRSTPVTRAEFASFIHQWISPADYSAPSASPFPDMTPESGHFEAVTWMHENDIVAGFADGEFRPSRHITRGEMAAVLSRLDSQIDPHGGATSPGCVDSGTPTLPDASDGPQRGVLRAPFTVHLKRTVEPGECLTLDPSGHGGIPQGYDNVSLITLGRTSGSDDGRVSTRVNADGTINITVDRDYWNRYGSEDVHATPFIAWKDQENYVKGHIYLIVTR